MILVTGASGLLGSFLCKELQKENIPFRGLIRENSNLELLSGIDPSNLVKGDILDPVNLDQQLQDCRKVIHSAAVVSFNPSDKEWMYRVNIEGTSNLVDLSLKNNIEKFIHISSVSAVGVNKGPESSDEDSPWPGASQPTRYGLSKYQAEVEVFRGEAEGLSTLILNPSTILGPGESQRSSTQLFRYVWDEKKFYSKGLLNYVDIRDLSEIVIKFLNTEIHGERFLVNAGTISYKDFFEHVAKSFNKRAPKRKVNDLLAKLVVGIEWARSKVTGKPPLITAETAAKSKSRVEYVSTKLIDKLNFQYRPIDESIQWTCQVLKSKWKKESGDLPISNI